MTPTSRPVLPTSPAAPATAPAGTVVAARQPSWPLERVLFALAGSITLLSVLLGAFVSRWFLLVGALVGVNQWLFVASGKCPASIVLQRTCGLRSLREGGAGAPGTGGAAH